MFLCRREIRGEEMRRESQRIGFSRFFERRLVDVKEEMEMKDVHGEWEHHGRTRGADRELCFTRFGVPNCHVVSFIVHFGLEATYYLKFIQINRVVQIITVRRRRMIFN